MASCRGGAGLCGRYDGVLRLSEYEEEYMHCCKLTMPIAPLRSRTLAVSISVAMSRAGLACARGYRDSDGRVHTSTRSFRASYPCAIRRRRSPCAHSRFSSDCWLVRQRRVRHGLSNISLKCPRLRHGVAARSGALSGAQASRLQGLPAHTGYGRLGTSKDDK